MPERSISGVGSILLIFVPIAAWVLWRARQRRHGLRHVSVALALAAWTAVVLYVALFPFPLPPYDPLDFERLAGDYRGFPADYLSLAPFTTISGSLGLGFDWPAARYLVGNSLAFAPLGFLAPLVGQRWDSWLRIGCLGLAMSLSIEVAQLVGSLLVSLPIHVADVDDLLLNTLSTFLGYGVLQGFRRVLGSRATAIPPASSAAE